MTMRRPRTLHRRRCDVCRAQRDARHFTRRSKTCDGCLPPLERSMTAAEVRAEQDEARGRADKFIARIREELDLPTKDAP